MQILTLMQTEIQMLMLKFSKNDEQRYTEVYVSN